MCPLNGLRHPHWGRYRFQVASYNSSILILFGFYLDHRVFGAGKVVQTEKRELAVLVRGKIRPGAKDEWHNELYVPPCRRPIFMAATWSKYPTTSSSWSNPSPWRRRLSYSFLSCLRRTPFDTPVMRSMPTPGRNRCLSRTRTPTIRPHYPYSGPGCTRSLSRHSPQLLGLLCITTC